MEIYKRRLQVKQYAKQHGLFFADAFYELLAETRELRFDELQEIRLPNGQAHLFFLNEGCVAGTLEEGPENPWFRLLVGPSVFGDFSSLLEIGVPKFHWFALGRVYVLAIPITVLADAFDKFPDRLEKLSKHIGGLESGRMHLLNQLARMPLGQKIELLETEHPALLVQSRYSHVAKYLGVSRESLSRVLKTKMYRPSLH